MHWTLFDAHADNNGDVMLGCLGKERVQIATSKVIITGFKS